MYSYLGPVVGFDIRGSSKLKISLEDKARKCSLMRLNVI